MPPLYGLTARTAEGLKRLLADGGSVGGRATGGPAARGVTWVKVTGPPDGDGWHPAVVSIDTAGEFEDLEPEVLVAAADASELVEDARYLCTRTGDDEDGVARFRTAPVPGTGGTDPTAYRFTQSIAAVGVSGRSFQKLTVPRGDYLVTAVVLVSFAGGAASTNWSIGRCNHSAAPTNPILPAGRVRIDGASGQFTSVTLHQLMRTGEYDDDGGTADIDFSVYVVFNSGSGVVLDVKQFTALRVS